MMIVMTMVNMKMVMVMIKMLVTIMRMRMMMSSTCVVTLFLHIALASQTHMAALGVLKEGTQLLTPNKITVFPGTKKIGPITRPNRVKF